MAISSNWTNPKADMSLEGGAWVMLNGDKGYYTKSEGTLRLEGNVNLFHDEGYEFHTQEALIYMEKGNAEGRQARSGRRRLRACHRRGIRANRQGKAHPRDRQVKVDSEPGGERGVVIRMSVKGRAVESAGFSPPFPCLFRTGVCPRAKRCHGPCRGAGDGGRADHQPGDRR